MRENRKNKKRAGETVSGKASVLFRGEAEVNKAQSGWRGKSPAAVFMSGPFSLYIRGGLS